MISREVEIGRRVAIGAESYVNAGTLIASGYIGKFCSIGYYCQIGMPEHPVHYLSTSPRTYGRNNLCGQPTSWEDYQEPPRIGNDVWVGSQAIILQGVSVGNGAVVAAGAVVTKSVEPYAIVAGVPARQVRKRFDEETIRTLEELKWWDWTPEELKECGAAFGGHREGVAWLVAARERAERGEAHTSFGELEGRRRK